MSLPGPTVLVGSVQQCFYSIDLALRYPEVSKKRRTTFDKGAGSAERENVSKIGERRQACVTGWVYLGGVEVMQRRCTLEVDICSRGTTGSAQVGESGGGPPGRMPQV